MTLFLRGIRRPSGKTEEVAYVPGGLQSPQVLQISETLFGPERILNMRTGSPLETVPAPGLGKINILMSLLLSTNSGTGYSWGGGLQIITTPGQPAIASISGDVLKFPLVAMWLSNFAIPNSDQSLADNKPISLISQISDPFGGDLNLSVSASYIVANLEILEEVS